jgi:hypothetical protein
MPGAVPFLGSRRHVYNTPTSLLSDQRCGSAYDAGTGALADRSGIEYERTVADGPGHDGIGLNVD